MSIATDEAEKKYPRDVALTVASENNVCRRTGYVAGRTAKVTEAEIEAAAKRLYEVTHAPEADPGWYRISEYKRKAYRDESEQMLIAAREAVTA